MGNIDRSHDLETTPSFAVPRPFVITGVVGLGVFLLLWIGYFIRFEPLLNLDQSVIGRLSPLAAKHSSSVSFFNAVSTVFGPTVFRLAAVLLIVLMVIRRQPLARAIFLAVGLLFGGLVLQLVKIITHRPRPEGAAISAFSSSFPSGHAFDITLGTLSLILIASPWLAGRWRWFCLAIAVLLIALVCFARLALDVHHLSDVVAGVGLGLAWMVAAWWITQRAGPIVEPLMERIRPKRGNRPGN